MHRYWPRLSARPRAASPAPKPRRPEAKKPVEPLRLVLPAGDPMVVPFGP